MLMKFFQRQAVAVVVLVLAIAAGVVIGQARKPDTSGQASTAIVGSYTYVYDYAGVLTDGTMEHIDAMNASLFAQTGAQILVDVVNSTGGVDIMDYAMDLGNTYGVGSAERNNGVVMLLALENISQSGLRGDYCVVVGTGLESHADDFASLQSYYLESDFAAGDYDAVRITIGEAQGHNWWCVLYPPICVPAAADIEDLAQLESDPVASGNPQYEPRFKILEILEGLKKNRELSA